MRTWQHMVGTIEFSLRGIQFVSPTSTETFLEEEVRNTLGAGTDPSRIQEVLNALGCRGWELVAVVDDLFYLKREVTEDFFFPELESQRTRPDNLTLLEDEEPNYFRDLPKRDPSTPKRVKLIDFS